MITRPLCVRSLLFFHVYEEDSAVRLTAAESLLLHLFLVKCTMKVYFWGRRLFFFYIGGRGWNVIRRSLIVNLCQSVLERQNEHKTAAECRCVTADLKCKAFRAVKRARNVQGPTLSADAIENSGTHSSLVRMTLRHASPTQRSSRRTLHRLFRVTPKQRPLDCISSSAVVFKRPLLLQLFSLFCLSVSWIQPLTTNVIRLVFLVWERVADRGRC